MGISYLGTEDGGGRAVSEGSVDVTFWMGISKVKEEGLGKGKLEIYEGLKFENA